MTASYEAGEDYYVVKVGRKGMSVLEMLINTIFVRMARNGGRRRPALAS